MKPDWTYQLFKVCSHLFGLALLIHISFFQASGSSGGQAVVSLKNQTNEELLSLITGRQPAPVAPQNTSIENKVQSSPLDRLWEMPPRDAALEFVKEFDGPSSGMTLLIDLPNGIPPSSGEVGLRWISGNQYATPEQGVTIIKNAGYESKLLISQVQIVGRASKEELDKAVMKTDSHPLPRLVAQQTYEILWCYVTFALIILLRALAVGLSAPPMTSVISG